MNVSASAVSCNSDGGKSNCVSFSCRCHKKNHEDTEKVMALTVLDLRRPFTLASVADADSTSLTSEQVRVFGSLISHVLSASFSSCVKAVHDMNYFKHSNDGVIVVTHFGRNDNSTKLKRLLRTF